MVSTFSSLIPPKIASPGAVTASGTGPRIARIASVYERLPKGPAPKKTLTGIDAYRGRFLPGGKSMRPMAVTIAALFVFGYTIDYQLHIKHHLSEGSH